MKIKNICSVLIATVIPYNLMAYDYPNLYVSQKTNKIGYTQSNKFNQNPVENVNYNSEVLVDSSKKPKNNELTVKEKDSESTSLNGINNGFSDSNVFQGVPDLGYSNDNTTINFMAGNIEKDDIIEVKKKKEELAKINNNPIENIVLKSDTMYYNPIQGLERTIYLKFGYSTDIEFVDELGNPISVRGMSVGNKIFNASNPEPNMLSLLATSKYKETNFNIRLEGIKDPIILRIKEGSNNISHTRVKIVVSDSKNLDETDEMNLKTNILSELLKYGTLHGKTQLDYEVVDIARKETTYFEKKYLKIFKVEKFNKTYNIVLLDNQFEILGMNKNSFNRYQNSFNVYFLPEYKEIFTIMTKLNEKDNHLSLDFEKDAGLIEKYRILINE